MTTIAHAISSGWVSSTGATGAQNYDEFASDAEITAVIAANPRSALAIEMPHRTPSSVAMRTEFRAALDAAATTFAAARDDGDYRPVQEVVAPYRISTDAGTAYGLFCLIDTDQISTSAAEPGLVIRNEDVFVGKVKERMELTARLGAVLSPVLLLQTADGGELHRRLADLTARLGPPAVTDLDQHGHEHAGWLVGPGPDQDRLLDLAGGGELIVADGNHRSLAAQEGGLGRFLAVVTTAESVRIQPYNRLITGIDADEAIRRLSAAGLRPVPVDGPPVQPDVPGSVVVHRAGASYRIDLPVPASGSPVDRLDHAVVERLLIGSALGLAPDDPAISYVGGDYPPQWLAQQVDHGTADLAVLIAPVSVEEFVAVNVARLTMPRKSTWFTPKARGGLVVAEVS
jgi:uncharacterized protein (DUF1015 family)